MSQFEAFQRVVIRLRMIFTNKDYRLCACGQKSLSFLDFRCLSPLQNVAAWLVQECGCLSLNDFHQLVWNIEFEWDFSTLLQPDPRGNLPWLSASILARAEDEEREPHILWAIPSALTSFINLLCSQPLPSSLRTPLARMLLTTTGVPTIEVSPRHWKLLTATPVTAFLHHTFASNHHKLCTKLPMRYSNRCHREEGPLPQLTFANATATATTTTTTSSAS